MSEGFKVADAYVELRTKDETAEGKAKAEASLKALGDNLKPVGLEAKDDTSKGVSAARSSLKTAGQGVRPVALEAKDETAEGTGKALSSIKGYAKAAGVAGAAALAAGMVQNMNIADSRAKLQAQLGLTAADASKYGKIAGDVYKGNFGESIDDVNTAIKGLSNNIEGFGNQSPAAIKKTTEAALTLGQTFGVDVADSAKAAGAMIQNGLAKNADEAFDIIASGFQQGLDASGDWLDTLDEYGPQFQKLGIDGVTATGLVSQGLKAGARDADTVADAIKEFSIRAIDGSKTTVDAYDSMGLSAGATAAAIAKGGPSAKTAFTQILSSLNSIKDPVERNRIGVELFGTKFEDLGPKVIAALDPAQASLIKTTGTIDDMTEALGSTGNAKIETFKRTFSGFIQNLSSGTGPLGVATAGVAAFGGQALTSAGDIGQIVTAMRGFSGAATTAATGAESAAVAGGKMKGAMVGLGAVAFAAAAAVGTLAAANALIPNDMESSAIAIGGAKQRLGEFLATGTSPNWSYLTGNFSNLKTNLEQLADPGLQGRIADTTAEIFHLGGGEGQADRTKLLNDLKSMDMALATMVTSGNATGAQQAFQDIASKAGLSDAQISQLKGHLPGYTDALASSTTAAKSLATGTDTSTDALKSNKAALDAAADAADAAASSFLKLRGSEVGFEAAADDATAAVKTNGRTLDTNTAKGRANRTALDNLANQTLEYRDSAKAAGASVGRQTAIQEDGRRKLIAVARQMGMSGEAAKRYANKILGIPGAKKTNVTANTGEANRRIAHIASELRSIPDGSATVRVYYRGIYQNGAQPGTFGHGLGVLRANGGLVGRANGGLTGRREGGGLLNPKLGGPRQDNVYIGAGTMASGGEYVINARATQRNLPLIQDINSGRINSSSRSSGSGAGLQIGTVNITIPARDIQEFKDATAFFKNIDQVARAQHAGSNRRAGM